MRTEGLSKRYRIGRRANYGRLTESLATGFSRPFRRERLPDEQRFIWALKDVSLQIDQGEVVGIIGRNGAGKTTLLKILSRVTWPTEGHAKVRGRVGTFLEVGTGFHPELTGRENVYLNGAILGLHKAEIDQKFNEIVEFAEIDKFLDTPVKFYSSGMHMRLAFAVAANLNTDVLFVDEVLAVGDYRFQQKCLETMRRVGETGDTVIMVSHDLGAIQTFCTSCVWLNDGRVVKVGEVEECVQSYLQSFSSRSSDLDVDVSDAERPANQGESFRFVRVGLRPGHADGLLRRGEPIRVDFEFIVTQPVEAVALGFSIHASDGTWVLQSLNTHRAPPYEEIQPGRYSVEATVPENVLVEGRYVLGVGARSRTEGLDWVREAIEFEVAAEPRASWWLDPGRAGVVRLKSHFGGLRPLANLKDGDKNRMAEG